jgi:hypothetical protein
MAKIRQYIFGMGLSHRHILTGEVKYNVFQGAGKRLMS